MMYLFDDIVCEVKDIEKSDVREIINEFDILSKTRETSNVWADTFVIMHQIVSGNFFCAHKFNKSWESKIISKYDIWGAKFTWSELIMRTRVILQYVTERKPLGFWFPKHDKVSLKDFYCSEMKSGECWSPFFELNFGDCITPQMFRKMFGPKITEKIDEILKDVWFSVDFDTKLKLYSGVDELHDWYCNLSDEFINHCDANRLTFGKFSSFLETIRQCNKETGCVYPSFITPRSPKWCILLDWLKKKKRVEF